MSNLHLRRSRRRKASMAAETSGHDSEDSESTYLGTTTHAGS
jgi:hypothetical protein